MKEAFYIHIVLLKYQQNLNFLCKSNRISHMTFWFLLAGNLSPRKDIIVLCSTKVQAHQQCQSLCPVE